MSTSWAASARRSAPTAPRSRSAAPTSRRAAYSELVDAALRQLNDHPAEPPQRLLAAARVLPELDLRAPSLLPGWTRAHVLAHLARNADAMRGLLIGARARQQRSAYASAQARDDD